MDEDATVRVCNLNTATKCASYTRAQLKALPSLRLKAVTPISNIGANGRVHYNWVAGSAYSKDNYVVVLAADGVTKQYYKLAGFRVQAAGFVSPSIPNQDVWFRDFSVQADATNPLAPVATTPQECIPVETIDFLRQLNAYNKSLPGG